MTDYKIGEVARLLGLTTQALRFYEQEGVVTPKKSENGTRYYDEDQLILLLSFKKYRQADFSVQDIVTHFFKEDDLSGLRGQTLARRDMLLEQSALPGFRGESGAKTWLFHIAVNTCRDMLRTGWMRMRRRSVPLEVMPELAGQEDERLREMTAAVLALPDKYRETVVLFYYKQMKIREIAEALHIPQNSVSSRLRRARAMLQIDMEGGKDA